jgi:hypothetical protein
MNRIFNFILIFVLLYGCSHGQQQIKKEKEKKVLEQAFHNPPDSTRSWVYWFWINGNITREGITADLESMKEVGVGGVLWMEVSGKWFAPEGQIKPYSTQWNNLMQWAIQEAERLGIEFDITLDFGYECGGPHITPDNSMQKLYWSQIIVDGGKNVDITLKRPEIPKEIIIDTYIKRLLKPGEQLTDKVQRDIEQIDSYRDIAILAIPHSEELEGYRIPQFDLRTGLRANTFFLAMDEISPPNDAVIPNNSIINLTNQMDTDGTLSWEAPPGKWQIIRLGHASNFKLTRPNPTVAVGLNCDRLSQNGINTHFEAFLKPIFEGAGSRAGKTLKYVHIDSWEAGTQNWTAKFPQEFRKRRGYNINPWLPVLTGILVDSPELSERFLWDFRKTINEMTLDNFHMRLHKLASAYDIQFSNEAYGNLVTNNIEEAENCDFPISEFWALGEDHYPKFKNQLFYNTMKVMASAAHTTGNSLTGAEAFTSSRGWKDHPFIIKGMGDKAFCEGVNQYILHLFAHQAYDNMVPGLTHQRWGEPFNRFNTWWGYSKPWFDYLNRSQFMLQQGKFVADVCYFFGEGAPLHVKDMELNLPHGYDYDICSSDIVQQMEVQDGRIILPSGMNYRYLLLPNTERLTLSSAEKIKELAESGALVIAQKRITGTPGLSGYPEANQKVKQIAGDLWDQDKIITENNWEILFQQNDLKPDFKGDGLNYIHRKTDNAEIYFVANPEPSVVETNCTFRVSGKIPELWNPETGETRELPEYDISEETVSVPLRFEPMQSWFVVFGKSKSTEKVKGKNFPEYLPVKELDGSWQVSFDPKWGGPEKAVTFDNLIDWFEYSDQRICYYSGTATYKKTFNLSTSHPRSTPVFLDLGKVEVMAQVRVNGKDCGIAWKPPYRLDITHALKSGDNQLEIDVVNTWVNRLIGDEQLPEDCDWLDGEILKEWPEWFLKNEPRSSGRYTFTSFKHYEKDDPLVSSGLLGPIRIFKFVNNSK